MKTAHILSLAGGGTFALIEARALMELYPNQSGHQILKQFDVAIGNSAGSIVLAGLAADLTPAQILSMFQDQTLLHKLYTPVSFLDRELSYFGISPRWSAAGKLAALQVMLGQTGSTAMTSLDVNIAICAYDLDRSRETLFRSYGSILTGTSGGFNPSLAEAAHASSNAPAIYFDAPAVIINTNDTTDTRRFWDGGLGSYNTPVRAGLAEAHALGFQGATILSLGTGSIWRPIGDGSSLIYTKPGNVNLLGTVTCLAKDCTVAPAEAALSDTYVCPNVCLVHLSPYVKPDGSPPTWTIPAAIVAAIGEDAWQRLAMLDMDVVDPNDVALLVQYADTWIAGVIPNEPILNSPLTGVAIAGDATFAAGQARWQKAQLVSPL